MGFPNCSLIYSRRSRVSEAQPPHFFAFRNNNRCPVVNRVTGRQTSPMASRRDSQALIGIFEVPQNLISKLVSIAEHRALPSIFEELLHLVRSLMQHEAPDGGDL